MALILIPEDNVSAITKVYQSSKGTLFLGNIDAATNLLLLEKNSIKAVITVASELNVSYVKLAHLKIEIYDHPFQNIAQYFSQTNDFISKNLQKGSVLVHCKAGISRSASIVIAFLMKHKLYCLKKAIDKVKSKRNIINPNQGFMAQLKHYQKKITQSVKNTLKR